MGMQRWTLVFGDDCGPDGKDSCAMKPAVTPDGGQYVLYADALERERALKEALVGVKLLLDYPSDYEIRKISGPITNGDQERIDKVFIAVDAALAQ